ncbi:lipoyl(octanoyl) transferase LipB [Legionella sp. W05-934-2]|uniref:lipoyl(octanoyl) transferase LipB n=1 Tax=Legionella sp. W05-934-2 TaxID=1198649 RepID=UPI003462E469
MIHKHLGLVDYESTWQKMKSYTSERDEKSNDELWFLQHPPVYTQGQAGKAEHILNPRSIPIIQTDRGGQVTYHGPGQLVVYFMLDIQRMNLGIRTLVGLLEKSLIELLSLYKIKAQIQCGAPGVYVDEAKIASIGLRVKKGRTYHGIALNIDMDLKPFDGINPCGYAKMKMVQVKDYVDDVSFLKITQDYENVLSSIFGN